MADKTRRPPYVQAVEAKGVVRLYFRKGRFRRRLLSPDGSDALWEEANAILAELAQIERSKTPIAGTVSGMLKLYNVSIDFLGRARSTQADYQRRIDEILEDAGAVLLSDVDAGWVSELMTEWARRGHRVARLNLQVLKNACMPAVIDGRIPSDPFTHQKRVRRPHDLPEPNPIWREAEIEAVIALALERRMPGLARAVALGCWAGFRRQTICAVPTEIRIQGYDDAGRRHRRLYWLTEKGRVICDKPEDERLSALLDATPDRASTIAYNARGEPFGLRALNQALDRLIDRLAEDGVVRPNLTLHGLRHTRGVELATAGASDFEIMCQLEHATVRSAQIYRRQAERRKLANSAQNKIDRVRKLRVARAAAQPKPPTDL